MCSSSIIYIDGEDTPEKFNILTLIKQLTNYIIVPLYRKSNDMMSEYKLLETFFKMSFHQSVIIPFSPLISMLRYPYLQNFFPKLNHDVIIYVGLYMSNMFYDIGYDEELFENDLHLLKLNNIQLPIIYDVSQLLDMLDKHYHSI